MIQTDELPLAEATDNVFIGLKEELKIVMLGAVPVCSIVNEIGFFPGADAVTVAVLVEAPELAAMVRTTFLLFIPPKTSELTQVSEQDTIHTVLELIRRVSLDIPAFKLVASRVTLKSGFDIPWFNTIFLSVRPGALILKVSVRITPVVFDWAVSLILAFSFPDVLSQLTQTGEVIVQLVSETRLKVAILFAVSAKASTVGFIVRV